MNRSVKWLEDRSISVLTVAAALAALVLLVGFTWAAFEEAKREYAYRTVAGTDMVRWRLHGLTYAEYTGSGGTLFSHHLVVTQVPLMVPPVVFPETRVLYFDAEYYSACKYAWTFSRRDRKCETISVEELAEMYMLLAQAQSRAAHNQTKTTQRRINGNEP